MNGIRSVLMFYVMPVWMKKQVSETRHERDSWCVNVFRDSVWTRKQVSETGHERDLRCVHVFFRACADRVMPVWMKKQVSESRHKRDSWSVNVFFRACVDVMPVWMKTTARSLKQDIAVC